MPQNYIEIKYEDARSLIQEADVLLFRNKGFFPYWIKQATESPYTHVALASWLHDEKGVPIHLECVEFREWKGGRVVNLSTVVKSSNKRIDVYRAPNYIPIIKFDDEKNEIVRGLIRLNKLDITQCMRQLTGLPYGWRRIFWLATFHLGILRLIPSAKAYCDALENDVVYPVCSTTVAHCYQKHFVDLTHNRCNARMEPSDVARSPILNYLFTLEA